MGAKDFVWQGAAPAIKVALIPASRAFSKLIRIFRLWPVSAKSNVGKSEGNRFVESLYIFVSVKFPEPVHPDCAPVKFHVPEIVLLFTLP